MRFTVRHQTIYRYSVPVQLAPHLLRLTPRRDGARVLRHNLTLQPQPMSQRERSDEFGNLVVDVSFSGSTQQLWVDSQFEVETFMPASLSQLWAALPWSNDSRDGLAAYRFEPQPDATVQRFANELAAQVGYMPLAFLDALTHTLVTRTDQQVRHAGLAQPAAATLASWQGACRDLTVLFVAACRCLGIPSRFTSGYLAPIDGLDAPRQLHAWPEVYLPGAGWRGWDPSQGQRVLNAHLPLSAAPTQTGTMPVEGGYFFSGSVVTTTLDFNLTIAVSG